MQSVENAPRATNRRKTLFRAFCAASRPLCPKAKQPRNPGRRGASVLEHALKQPGGSQMRKQMRSTFRTPGTEDGNVDGNAHRSGGAEPCARCHRGRRRTGRERNGRRASEKRPVDPIRSMPGTKSCIICTLGSPWLVLWRKQHRFFRIFLVSAGIPIPPRNSTSPPHHP